jgi:hypothetical protein
MQPTDEGQALMSRTDIYVIVIVLAILAAGWGW